MVTPFILLAIGTGLVGLLVGYFWGYSTGQEDGYDTGWRHAKMDDHDGRRLTQHILEESDQ